MLTSDEISPEILQRRCFATGQSLEAQLEELKAAGAKKIFQQKATGKQRERAQLDRVLKTLGEGDVLIVTRLDRLARSSRDLLNIIKHSARSKRLAHRWRALRQRGRRGRKLREAAKW